MLAVVESITGKSTRKNGSVKITHALVVSDAFSFGQYYLVKTTENFNNPPCGCFN